MFAFSFVWQHFIGLAATLSSIRTFQKNAVDNGKYILMVTGIGLHFK